jgi:hypothetical protein
MVFAYSYADRPMMGIRPEGIKTMRMKLVLAATTMLSLTAIGMARANVIETGSIASQTAVSYASPGSNVILSQYDTLSLPTLTGIVLTVTTSEAANVGVNNNSGTNYSFTNGTASVLISLTGPGGVTTFVNTTATVASGTAFANTITNFAGLTGTTTYTTTISGANLAAYEGLGTVSLNFLAVTGGASFSGNSSFSVVALILAST